MKFEAIYYSGPAPSSMSALGVLGLVFDRVIFPGVYLPFDGVDVEATRKELQRIKGLGIQQPDDLHLVNLMTCAVNAEYLEEFCVFTGDPDSGMKDGAEPLTHALEELYFGPPPLNFYPTITLQFSKSLPGDETKAYIFSPSWLSYPANALLYAARSGGLLLNDNPRLPVPAPGDAAVKDHAQVLASILALESVRLVLPSVQTMSFAELADFRAESGEAMATFRSAMLRLSKDLNGAILSDASIADVQRQAQFLVETTVLPELEDLRARMREPTKPWHRRLVDLAKDSPELVANFATLPKGPAVAKVLARLADLFADVRDAQLEREGAAKRGASHFLLKIEGRH
jgi:hypothetical protein